MPYFSGQGEVYIADVVNGFPGAFRWVGNSPQFDVGFEVDTLDHQESYTGKRVTDARLLVETAASLSIILEEWNAKNLAQAVVGDVVSLTGNSVVGESLANGATTLSPGDFVRLAEPNVSAVDVKDSLSASLVLDTDFRVWSAPHGTLEILTDLSGFTGPFVADYTSGVGENVRMLTAPLVNKWVRLDAKNTASGDDPALVELYKVTFDPAEVLNLISNEYFQATLNGVALIDQTKDNDPTLGNFGRIVIGLN